MRKYLSRKFLLTLVCVALLCYIIFTNQSDFESVAMLLAGEIIAYSGANVLQKRGGNR